VARTACQEATIAPIPKAAATAAPAANASLLRRKAFWKRYAFEGGRATTGSWFKFRLRSAASPLAVS